MHHNEFLLHVPLNRSKLQRDKERDISEQIALGLASAPPSQEALYDQRLFNQSKVIYVCNVTQSVPNGDRFASFDVVMDIRVDYAVNQPQCYTFLVIFTWGNRKFKWFEKYDKIVMAVFTVED